MLKKKICICGGGSQGHILAGVIGSNNNYSVRVLTRRPKEWSKEFKTFDLDNKEYTANLEQITDNPREVIPNSDIVLICLPGYAIPEYLEGIKEYLNDNTILGSIFAGSGFFLSVIKILGNNTKCFGLQRVPFTGRPIEYGHSARLKGYKPYLKVAGMNIPDHLDEVMSVLEDWFKIPVYKLSHYLEATLSNSNPILHPVRMYVLFKDWTPDKIYNRIPFLYGDEWDDETSALWIDCDNELHAILNYLPVRVEEVPTILDYYGCTDVKSLTKKMQSIEPFKGVQPHMLKVDNGYILDIEHRYFIEDVPFGLAIIKTFAEKFSVPTPKIDMVLEWAQRVMGNGKIKKGKHFINEISAI